MTSKTRQQKVGESSSSTSYANEGRSNMAEDYNYSTEQMADIFAKLEVAKLLMKLGSDMAKQAETDIKFYRMTNKLPEGDE